MNTGINYPQTFISNHKDLKFFRKKLVLFLSIRKNWQSHIQARIKGTAKLSLGMNVSVYKQVIDVYRDQELQRLPALSSL